MADADLCEDLLLYTEATKRARSERDEIGSGASDRARASGAERRSTPRQRLESRGEMDRSPESGIGSGGAFPRRAEEHKARREADGRVR